MCASVYKGFTEIYCVFTMESIGRRWAIRSSLLLHTRSVEEHGPTSALNLSPNAVCKGDSVLSLVFGRVKKKKN